MKTFNFMFEKNGFEGHSDEIRSFFVSFAVIVPYALKQHWDWGTLIH